jgi:hypothetical protein
MHEVFLQRLAAHPILRNDNNFRVFLEYKEDVMSLNYCQNFYCFLHACFLVKCSW